METAHLSQQALCLACGKRIDEEGGGLFCFECSAALPASRSFYDLLAKEKRASERSFWDFRARLYERMLPVTMALGNGSFSYYRAVEEVAEIALEGAALGRPVLDVATGTGLVIKNLIQKDPNRIYIGLDYSQNMLHLAKKNLCQERGDKVTFIRGDAHQLPFASSFFGSITCAAAFGNMRDPERVAQEMARVTIRGGTITLLLTLMEEKAQWNLRVWKRLMDGLYRVGQVPLRWFSEEGVIQTLEEAGYCDVKLKSLGGTWQIITGRLDK